MRKLLLVIGILFLSLGMMGNQPIQNQPIQSFTSTEMPHDFYYCRYYYGSNLVGTLTFQCTTTLGEDMEAMYATANYLCSQGTITVWYYWYVQANGTITEGGHDLCPISSTER